MAQYLAQGHFDMQTRGIEPSTFQQQDAGSTPESQTPQRRGRGEKEGGQKKEEEEEKQKEKEKGEEGQREAHSSYLRFFIFHVCLLNNYIIKNSIYAYRGLMDQQATCYHTLAHSYTLCSSKADSFEITA